MFARNINCTLLQVMFSSEWNNCETLFQCWITTPSFVQKLFRPPQDCSICQDVQQVDKLSAVDPTIFEQRY